MAIDCNEVLTGRLWVGSFVRPDDAKQLRRMGITIVISLQTDQDLKRHRLSLDKLTRSLSEENIDLRRLPVVDFNQADLASHLPECVAEVETALAPGWAKAYLHCTAGMMRSPTVAAAYLVKECYMPAEKACEYIKQKRECNPDAQVLEQYERKLRLTTED